VYRAVEIYQGTTRGEGGTLLRSDRGAEQLDEKNQHVQPRAKLLGLIEPADLPVLLGLLVLGFLFLVFYQRIESFNEDSSYYIGLADSLAKKARFEFDFKLHTQHPPGLPGILALVALFFGANYSVYVRTVAICGILGLVVTYFLLRRKEGRLVATAACLLLASSPFFFELSTRGVLSELPYFLTSTMTLLLASLLQTARGRSAQFFSWLSLVFFLLLSLMIRSAGIALVGGIFFWLVYSLVADKRRRAALHLGTFGSVLVLGIGLQLLWMGWVKKVVVQDWPGQYMNEYVNQMKMKDPRYPEKGSASPADILHRADTNLLIEGAHFSELLTRVNWIDRLWFSPVVLFPIVLILLGCVVSVSQDNGDFLAWYFLSYVGIFLLWPFDPGPRAILPVFPLAFLFLWRGSSLLVKLSIARPRVALLGGGLFSLALCGFSYFWVRLHKGDIGSQAKFSLIFWPALASIYALCKWIRLRTPVGKILQPAWSSRPVFSVLGKPLTAPFLASSSALILLVGMGFLMQMRIGRANLSPDPTKFLQYPSVDAAKWIESNALPTDVVMAGQEAIVHRISRRRIIQFPVTSNIHLIMETIQNHNVSYLIVLEELNQHPFFFPTEDERWQSLSGSFPEEFRLVHKGPGYAIYRVASESTARPAVSSLASPWPNLHCAEFRKSPRYKPESCGPVRLSRSPVPS
jgi:4-amino-4-deoxy-L-arabinose transferase-like glycosyltransferase